MQGKHLVAFVALSALASAGAVAGEAPRRQPCPKVEPQRQPAVQQQRVRTPECRLIRNVPPVVDPTPLFTP